MTCKSTPGRIFFGNKPVTCIKDQIVPKELNHKLTEWKSLANWMFYYKFCCKSRKNFVDWRSYSHDSKFYIPRRTCCWIYVYEFMLFSLKRRSMKSNGGIRKRLAPTLMAAMLLPTQQQLEMICGLMGHPLCKTMKKREKKRNLLLQVGPIKTIFQTCLN